MIRLWKRLLGLTLSASVASGAAFNAIPQPDGGSALKLKASRTHQFAKFSGMAWKRETGTMTWEKIPFLKTDFGTSIHTQGDTVLIAQELYVQVSIDNGITWNRFPRPPIPDSNTLVIYQISSSGILCGDNNPWVSSPTGVFLTQDLGKSWRGPFFPGEPLDQAVVWKGQVVASGLREGVVRLDPGTGIRTPMEDGLMEESGLELASYAELLLGNGVGGLYRYSEAENRWKTMLAGPTQQAQVVKSMLRVEGNRVIVAHSMSDVLEIQESMDRGETWTKRRSEFRAIVNDLLPVGSTYLAAHSSLGVVRLDTNLAVVGLENEGTPRETLKEILLAGNRLIGNNAFEHAFHLSDDMGRSWTKQVRILDDLPSEISLHPMGKAVYLQTPDSMVSLSPPGIGPGSFPLPPGSSRSFRLVDAGDRVFFMEQRSGQRTVSNHLHVARKSDWSWTPLPALPLTLVSNFNVDGSSILAVYGKSAYRSLDAGATWTPMPAPPWDYGGRIHSTTNHTWIVGSEKGLFRADLQQPAWIPLAFLGRDIKVLTASGNRLFVQRDSDSVLFSQDAGNTWSTVSLPFPTSELEGMVLSDTLACCMSWAMGSTPIYCVDLAELPLGLAQSRWKQTAFPKAISFKERGMEFSSPYPGGPAIDALGRTRNIGNSRPEPRKPEPR